MLPLLIAGLIVLGVAAVIGAGVAIGKLIEAGKDADANFFDCPVGSPSGTCPAKALSEHGKTEVKQAMADAKAMLEKTKKDLETWDQPTQGRAKKWFGDSSEATRQKMLDRTNKELDKLSKLTTDDFHPAEPGEEDCYAYVYPNDDTKIYLGNSFPGAPATGKDSKAGTLVHEMSHFNSVGGTKDNVYGTKDAQDLAKTDPAKAQANADSFEYFVEGQ
jgi:peptidyl-Lys metalloendopeptidase